MPQAEIEHELRTSGSGFAQGKQRIMELFQTQPDRNLRAKALAKEYGIGGHSHSYLDGRSGFITYNSSGMEFSLHSAREPFKLKWAAIEQYIDLMIQSGRYLTDEEREQRTAAQEATIYKVGDEVVVDLPTRTIEGTIGYVGETDVRIDTSAHGHSWDNEVINKPQFEDALRQEEPDEPEADITVAGFETSDRRDFYDLAVGNVPFGNYKVNDKAYNKLGFSILAKQSLIPL